MAGARWELALAAGVHSHEIPACAVARMFKMK
jgi:hypothetical protein